MLTYQCDTVKNYLFLEESWDYNFGPAFVKTYLNVCNCFRSNEDNLLNKKQAILAARAL